MTARAAERVDPVKLPDDVRRRLEDRMVDAFERTRFKLAATETRETRRNYDALLKAALAVVRGVPV